MYVYAYVYVYVGRYCEHKYNNDNDTVAKDSSNPCTYVYGAINVISLLKYASKEGLYLLTKSERCIHTKYMKNTRD